MTDDKVPERCLNALETENPHGYELFGALPECLKKTPTYNTPTAGSFRHSGILENWQEIPVTTRKMVPE